MPVTRRGESPRKPPKTRLLSTTREKDGYDFMRGRAKLWFEAWGSGPKDGWTTRTQNGGPPRPAELAAAEYIVYGMENSSGHVTYKTRTRGLDV